VDAVDAPCVDAPADGSTYIVSPQFAGSSGTATVNYEMGTVAPPQQDVAPYVANGRLTRGALTGRVRGLQQSFDYMLRQKERTLAGAGRNGARPQANVISAGPPPLGSQRIFQVCSDLTCGTFKTDTATAQYVGTKIAIYVSGRAPAGGFTAGDLTAMGNTFDQDLYPIDVSAFGAPSDLDGNGIVIVLMTPYVNQITPSSECATLGFVAGFFFGNDLTNGANSNHGEVFYSMVPDPGGAFSCVHSTASVGPIVLPTFIHEFQHMISWNQHVIVRSGASEEVWLNEGLSHIAEELGSLYYENKYPPPTGRTDPTQLFPDSSQGFISGDLFNSYSFLESSGASSITVFANSGSLEERGGAWLFLRWLTDQKGQAILGKLDQTSLTGVANVAAQAGEPFNGLFGDFTAAVFGDSLPGFPRTTVTARDRFLSRNLRLIYNRIYTNTQGTSNPLPTPFPVVAMTLPVGSKSTSSMLIGTMEYWKLTMPSTGTDMRLHFQKQGGGSFPSSYLAQLSVLRCPAASACP
jgi:hypothetical protein